MAVHIGDVAPDLRSFGAPSSPATLPETRGRWTVVFFFPRGNHPHCVMESRRFQTLLPEFERLGVLVIGVSVDSAEQQQYFRNFCVLSFPLVSDTNHRVSQSFGVLDSAEIDGEAVTYARRETFLIGPDQRAVQHWTAVDPDSHAAAVLKAVSSLLEVRS